MIWHGRGRRNPGADRITRNPAHMLLRFSQPHTQAEATNEEYFGLSAQLLQSDWQSDLSVMLQPAGEQKCFQTFGDEH